MEKIVSVEEMRTIEREADTKGLSYDQMMENAGNNLALQIDKFYAKNTNKSILALVGTGNNGGDALVAIAELSKIGWQTSAYLIRSREDDDPLLRRITDQNTAIFTAESDPEFLALLHLLEANDVVLDGVLGTGIRLPLHNDVATYLEYVRQYKGNHPDSIHVVSVDCPSGIDCNDGKAASQVVPSEYTVTMAAVKRGLLNFPAADLIGNISVVSIGDLSDLKSWQDVDNWLVDSEYITSILPKRSRNSHKGTFGTAMVVAGSINYTGAALLAGEAAYRIGAGLVQIAVPSILHQVLAGQIPEAIWLPLPHEDGFIDATAVEMLINNIGKVTSLLIGPGFGLQKTTLEFIREFINSLTDTIKLPPLVIDADGLKMLKSIPDWYKKLPKESILTPHPGEMSILCGLTTEEIQSERINVAKRFSEIWEQIVVLKGAYTVIASPNGKAAVIPIATPALARAGTGDVLAGLIVGLLAQGVSPYKAAVAGAWIHATAGIKAEKKMGAASTLASDVLQNVADVLLEIKMEID